MDCTPMSAISNYACHFDITIKYNFFLSPILLYNLDVGKIAYKPDAGPEETMTFKHYNATEV